MSLSLSTSSFSAKPQKKKRKSRRSGKLKKQEKIRRIILNYGNKGLQISFKQIANKVDCTTRYAEITVAKLVKAGKVIKTNNEFISKKYAKERVLCGKNLYTSPKPATPKKSEEDNPKSTEKNDAKIRGKTPRNSSKEELANGTTHRDFFKRKKEEEVSGKEKSDLFKRYELQDLYEKAPDWWFRDLKKLKNALKLTRMKIQRGYNCRNKINFISFLLKHGIFGYRRHCARNLSLAINKPNLERVEPFLTSEPLCQGYDALRELRKKHDLDVQFTNIQKLLRKGFSHLGMSAEVMLQRLKLPGVKNVDAFLHHLVGMKEPYDCLKKKEA